MLLTEGLEGGSTPRWEGWRGRRVQEASQGRGRDAPTPVSRKLALPLGLQAWLAHVDCGHHKPIISEVTAGGGMRALLLLSWLVALARPQVWDVERLIRARNPGASFTTTERPNTTWGTLRSITYNPLLQVRRGIQSGSRYVKMFNAKNNAKV